MSNDKNRNYDNQPDSDFASDTASATRARNRTVMLTPEITGQVRARLAKETDDPHDRLPQESEDESFAAADALESTRGASGGFRVSAENHGFSGGSYAPASPPPAAPRASSEPVYAPQHSPAPAPVQHAAMPQPRGGQNLVWSKVTPLIGFLVSFDGDENGEFFELRSGRLIISCEPAAGSSYLVINDKSVSPMHAILRIETTGMVQVLDQLSEYGTRIIRFGSQDEEQISGEKSTIEHGDIIKFGERTFHVCILALNC